MKDKEIDTEISMWLPDGMVDVVDSKSAEKSQTLGRNWKLKKWPDDGTVDMTDSKSVARKGVRVQVSVGPPLFQLSFKPN